MTIKKLATLLVITTLSIGFSTSLISCGKKTNESLNAGVSTETPNESTDTVGNEEAQEAIAKLIETETKKLEDAKAQKEAEAQAKAQAEAQALAQAQAQAQAQSNSGNSDSDSGSVSGGSRQSGGSSGGSNNSGSSSNWDDDSSSAGSSAGSSSAPAQSAPAQSSQPTTKTNHWGEYPAGDKIWGYVHPSRSDAASYPMTVSQYNANASRIHSFTYEMIVNGNSKMMSGYYIG